MRRINTLFVFLGVFALLAADPAQSLRFGMSLFNDGLYEEALQAFDGVLQEAPASPEAEQALFYSGECWRLRDDQVRAGVNYRRLLEGFPATSLREKTLARYGESLVAQQKYAEAAMQLEDLMQRYPQSEQTKVSLALLAQAWYQTGAYGRLIETVEKWQQTYKGAEALPEAIYWEAETLLARGMEQEGRTLLERLAGEYQNYDAGWMAVVRIARIIEKNEGPGKAAEWLRVQLWGSGKPGAISGQIPRHQTEELARMLLRLEQKNASPNNHPFIVSAAQYLYNTFQNSEYSEYYYVAYLSSLGLGMVLTFVEENPHEFRDAELGQQRDLIVLQAMMELTQQQEEVIQKASELQQAAVNDSIRAQALLFQARVYDYNPQHYGVMGEVDPRSSTIGPMYVFIGDIHDALRIYRELLSRYAAWIDVQEINYRVGEIYDRDMNRPDLAIPYYRQAANSSDDELFLDKVYLALAEANVSLGRYNDALFEIDQAPMARHDEGKGNNDVKVLRYRLHRLYETSTDDALASFARSIVAFAEGGSQAQLCDDLSTTLAVDARHFEEALELAPAEQTPANDLRRALLLIDLIEKNVCENNFSDIKSHLKQLNSIRSRYSNDSAVAQEIDLNLQLRYEANYETSPEFAARVETLLSIAPDAPTRNLLHLAAADGRLSQTDNARALPHLLALEDDGYVPTIEYRRGKRLLGDIQYNRADYAGACLSYEQAHVDLFSGGAEALYRYAVSLKQTGMKDKALGVLCAALERGEIFPGYAKAVITATDDWMAAHHPYNAMRCLHLMPDADRNADYWVRLADIQLALNRPQDALKALQNAPEKEVPTLLKLADLQVRTGDYAAAARSFADLATRDPGNKALYQVRQAQALFAQEQYTEALAVFDKVAPTLTADASRYTGFDLREVAAQTVIACYRAGNRPKAEQYAKQFQSLLSDSTTKARLDLNEGIYYVRMDPGKSVRLLGKLADDTAVNAAVRREAQFWRGVAYINDNKPDKATTDFQALARQTDDPLMQAQARLKLGTLSFSAEQFDDALGHYSWVIEHDTRGDLALDALENYAMVCKAIDAWDRAVTAYELLLQRKPDTAMQAKTRFDVAYCYYRAGKYDRAYALFTEVLPELTTPELKAEAQFWMGACRFDQEDYEQAVNEYLKVSYNYADLAQWSATAELKAADAYIRLGKTDRARSLLERIITKYGRTSDWGREAGKVLERL